jgi:DNA-binding NarL/FixJ family response regulator
MTKFYGGVGYLLKDRVSDLATFASDVRRVASGDCVIDPELVARLVDKKHGDPVGALTEEGAGTHGPGRSNIALSQDSSLSAKTVEAHVRSIFTKLDLGRDPGGHRRVLAVLAFLRS